MPHFVFLLRWIERDNKVIAIPRPKLALGSDFLSSYPNNLLPLPVLPPAGTFDTAAILLPDAVALKAKPCGPLDWSCSEKLLRVENLDV